MCFRFRRIWRSEIVEILCVLGQNAFYSELGGCHVVRTFCCLCGKPFEEEISEAKRKVVCGVAFKCLSCDSDAGERTVWLVEDRNEKYF